MPPVPMHGDAPMVLQRLLLRACRGAGGRFKMADSLGTRLTGHDLLTRILAARSVLERVLAADERMVGVLLPPSVGAAVVNAARRGLIDRRATVVLDGGELTIAWRADGHVEMTGPFSTSFDGVLALE